MRAEAGHKQERCLLLSVIYSWECYPKKCFRNFSHRESEQGDQMGDTDCHYLSVVVFLSSYFA